VQDVLRHPPARGHPEPEAVPAEGLTARLVAVPLFGGLSSDELLAVVHGLALRTFEPGDALVTEGETGRSLFILTSGRGKVFVRSRDGHSVEVGRVAEGDFFGEISALSGSRRGATVTAVEACEALELEREALDAIALAHPRVRETLEARYLAHAGDPDAAAVRAVDLRDRHAPRRALEILETRFGESHWTPRMRLRLADVLAKAGHYDDAVPVLVSLADDLVRNGRPEKAIAIVKKIERIQQRDVAELPLAPMARGGRETGGRPAPSASEKARARDGVEADTRAHGFEEWLIRLAREAVRGRESAPPGGTEGREPPPGYGPGLRSSALFEDFSDAELLALVGGLRLVCHGPGDIIVSEGEPGESVYVVATGTVKVLVRDPLGRSVAVCHLGEGSFFGEIAALSGRPRSATVIAAESCELLELDRSALDVISAQHPRVREVLERAYLERASDPAAEHARTVARG
jgi:CRP-like cAMP-binding protein